MMDTRQMVETFQCPGCAHGENTRCGMFKLHEIPYAASRDDGKRMIGGFRCRNHETTANIGGYVNLGLPQAFSRVQYRDGREEIRTNIRLHLYPVDYGVYWDGFNVPVWMMVKNGVLFVRTFNPRTDQSFVDVIQGGSLESVRERYIGAIDVGPIADKIPL